MLNCRAKIESSGFDKGIPFNKEGILEGVGTYVK